MKKNPINLGNNAIEQDFDLECKEQDLLNLSKILLKNYRNKIQETSFFTL